MRNRHKEENDYFSKSKKYFDLIGNDKKFNKEMQNNTPLFNEVLSFLEQIKDRNPYAGSLLQTLKLRGKCEICWTLTHKEQDPVFVVCWCGEYDDDLVFEAYFMHRMMDHDKPKDMWRRELCSLYHDIKSLCRVEKGEDSFGWSRRELCGRNTVDDCVQTMKKMKKMIDHTPMNLGHDYRKLYRAAIYRINQAFKL